MATSRDKLEGEMRAAAEAGEYERAARLRDELRALSIDESEIHAQVPGAMGVGTNRPRPETPAGWTPPKKPDLMTRGRRR